MLRIYILICLSGTRSLSGRGISSLTIVLFAEITSWTSVSALIDPASHPLIQLQALNVKPIMAPPPMKSVLLLGGFAMYG
jgi:hypothetical protein